MVVFATIRVTSAGYKIVVVGESELGKPLPGMSQGLVGPYYRQIVTILDTNQGHFQ